MVVKKFYRKKKNISTIVKRAVAAEAKKNVEVKHRFITYSTDIDSNGYGLQVHDFISQGTGVGNRVGSRINMLSLNMNSRMQTDSSNGGTLRILVLETRRPLAFQVLNQRYDIRPLFDTSAATVGHVAASLDYDWVKKVYLDKRIHFSQTVAGSTYSKFVKFHKSFGNGKKIIYDQDTVAPAVTLTKTYLYVCFVSDNQMNADIEPSIYLKLRYTDE